MDDWLILAAFVTVVCGWLAIAGWWQDWQDRHP